MFPQEREDVVIRWVDQVVGVPPALQPLVTAYNVRKQIADSLTAYTSYIDDEMNTLFDAMLILVKEVNS